MQRAFVTGAAGFIGSSLCDCLLREAWEVIGWDNFSTGQKEFIEAAKQHPQFRIVAGDNLDSKHLTEAMVGCNVVFHLAANADLRFGLEHPSKDLEQNTIATFNVLEAMRSNQNQKDRLCLNRLRLWRSDSYSDSGGCAVSHPNLSLAPLVTSGKHTASRNTR
jgi:nucleoside-diphosphate-sugar epimerase